MTVICWDGTTLAADKLNWTNANSTITKIRKIRGDLYGITGKTVLAQIVWKWIEDGMKADEMPLGQQDAEKHNTIMRITKKGLILIYENSATPWVNEQTIFAIGGGAEIAVGAMEVGASAIRAVEAAIKHNPLCGGGIDSLILDEVKKGKKK